MIALDTNVLVRYVTQDDDPATPVINERIAKGGRFFIANLVLAELVWVLRRSYKWTRQEVFETLEALITTDDVVMENRQLVERATSTYERGGDWADHLIIARAMESQCTGLLTLDQNVRKTYPEFAQNP